jgi:hypothetical protein
MRPSHTRSPTAIGVSRGARRGDLLAGKITPKSKTDPLRCLSIYVPGPLGFGAQCLGYVRARDGEFIALTLSLETIGSFASQHAAITAVSKAIPPSIADFTGAGSRDGAIGVSPPIQNRRGDPREIPKKKVG